MRDTEPYAAALVPHMKNFRSSTLEVIFCLVVFVLVNTLSSYFQPRISVNEGKGWDGSIYYGMAEQITKGEPIQAAKTWCFRLGVPFLAALVSGHNLILGFRIVNLAANVLTLVLFVIWIRLFINDWRIRCLLVLLLLTQWHGPFRFVYYYPILTEYTYYSLLLLGLLCIHLARTRLLVGVACLGLVVFFGVAFRETLFLLAVMMPFADNPIVFNGFLDNLVTFQFANVVRMPRRVYWLPILLGLLSFVLVRLVAHPSTSYSFVRSALGTFYCKPWWTCILGVFAAYGPILVLLIYNWRRSWAFLASNQPLLVFMAASGVLAYVGGSDTERYCYWAMPVTYVLIGKAIEDNRILLQSKALLLVICLTQAISQRLFWTLPADPYKYPSPLPILTIPSSRFHYFDLYSAYSLPGEFSRVIMAISFAQYVLLAVLILWWLSYREKRQIGRP